MLKSSELATRKCVENNRSLFEDVAKGFVNAKDIYQTEYSILDYETILNQMIEFVDGYAQYSKEGDKKYNGKVLTISRNFYDRMFTDKKYRRKITLDQFKDVNTIFLQKTKQIQNLIEGYLKQEEKTSEMSSFLSLTNNQYKKIAKVYRDDMKIYLWLTTSNSKFFSFNLDASTRSEFTNKFSPVMHKAKKDDD